jgi:ubiquinone biosynthesis protein COQ9
MAEEFVKTRDRIVVAMLPHVAFEGWTRKALAAGVADAGYPASMAERSFAGGLVEVANHFGDFMDRRMLAELAGIDLDAMRVRDRIHTCIKVRIQINAVNREAVRRLMSFLALSTNAGLAARLVWRSCSEIWYAAGDDATDWNHYSKRILLVPVYTSTLLYWLSDPGDEAADYPETWAYLARRIDNVLQVFGLSKRLSDRLFGGLKGLCEALPNFTTWR